MAERFPFTPYPTGWFQAAYSDELPVGQARPLRYFGRDLVLFRTAAGLARALDAHCPHLGAHLGHGGCVEGELIRCPFHGWKFSGTGACEGVPYGDQVPRGAALRSWPVHEADGMVWVHHHPQGEAPSFSLPALAERGSQEWTPWLRRRWTIRTHVQETLENMVDAAHFLQLHGHPGLPRTRVSAEGSVIRAHATVKMRAPGERLVDGTIDWECVGMGCSILRIAGAMRTLCLSSATPIDEESVDLRFSFSMRKDGPPGLGDAVLHDILRQIEQDIVVWEHKAYLPKPVLAEGESAIMVVRDWCRQFLRD